MAAPLHAPRWVRGDVKSEAITGTRSWARDLELIILAVWARKLEGDLKEHVILPQSRVPRGAATIWRCCKGYRRTLRLDFIARLQTWHVL
jgi:hypothetical protein